MDRYPIKPVKAPKKVEQITVFVIHSQHGYALDKRPEKGLLAGLYQFPNASGFMDKEEVAASFGQNVTALEDARHVFTHIVWEMRGYLIETESENLNEDFLWATPEEIKKKYSLPSAFSAYKKYCK